MNGFLNSIGYDRWILVALLAIPLAGAAIIWLQGALGGRSAGAAPQAAPEESASARAGIDPRTDLDEIATGVAGPARTIALATFLVEFVVSLGLWWAFDPADGRWQFVFDKPWIPSWGARFTIGRIQELGGLRGGLPPKHAQALFELRTNHEAWRELTEGHHLGWDTAEALLTDALTRSLLA